MHVTTLIRSPVLIAQALWVMARASRLPEAAGARSGTLGEGPERCLLIIGDSSAAGVGVEDQSQALGGQLARALSHKHKIHWQVVAKSGATVQSALAMLECIPDEPTDMVLTALGVNDTKNGVRSNAWEDGYRTLLTTLSRKFDDPYVCMSGVPQLRHFPLLPYPLSDVLGARSERFDTILQELAAEWPKASHLSMAFPLHPENMASDGFHPSGRVYREWAERAAKRFAEMGALGQ